MLGVSGPLPRVAMADIDNERSDEQQAVEKKTKVAFPRIVAATDELPELVLTGVGVRSKFRFKVYAGAHYLAAGTELGDDPRATVIGGGFARRIIMHFVRDVGAEKIVKAFREGFEKNGYDPEAPELAADLTAFLAYFDRDLVKGDVIELTASPEHGVRTVVVGEAKEPIAGELFARGLWAIWFGEKPVSKGLREDLLELAVED
jgi:hypothetical protein